MLVLVGSHLIARQVSGVLAKMSKYISRENYNIFDINSISDFMKIATTSILVGIIMAIDKCIMDVLLICALLFGQTLHSCQVRVLKLVLKCYGKIST